MNVGDLVMLIDRILEQRSRNTVRVTEVKEHADKEMVLVGQVRKLDWLGNNTADDSADFGRRRVDPVVIDARRNLSGVKRRWYPIIMELHRFFSAISRVVVNHDDCIAGKTGDQYIEAMSQVCDVLHGDVVVAAQEVGFDNLCEIIDGRPCGIDTLINHMRGMVFPREDPLVHPQSWLRADRLPPSPFLQCDRALTRGGSGVLSDPVGIDQEFRKAWLPYFCRSGQRETSLDEFNSECDGWLFRLREFSLPALTGDTMAAKMITGPAW